MNPQAYPPPQFVPTPVRKPSRIPKGGFILAIIVTVAILGFAGIKIFSASKTTLYDATQTANQFLTLMQSHNFSAAHDMLAPEEQASTPVRSLQNLEVLFEENHGTITNWANPQWYLQDNNGIVYTRLTYSLTCKQSSSQAEIVVERTGDTYAIYSFNYKL